MNERRKNLMDNYYNNKIPNVEILIDNVWDPHNVAAVSRTADGLGISTIHLYYTYNELPNMNKVGKKTSSSATKWIHFEKVENLTSFVEAKKFNGFQLIGTDMGDSAKQLNQYTFPQKCIIIMGSESGGMSSELKAVCDHFITIPMVGMVTSYNISVATAIILYEVFRQKGQNLKLKSIEDFQDNRNFGKHPHHQKDEGII